MKLRTITHTDEGSTPLRHSTLEIGDHSFIMNLVMEGMYSQPIKAICREIASNCRDAHREIGTPNRPIEITLPNNFEESIAFKDYGLGISPDRMDNIYTKLGRSSKRDSNDQTGGFGLGAKTPFAYTSQFSVVTVSEIKTQNDVDVLNLTNTSYTLSEVIGKNMRCVHTASRGDNDGGAGYVKLHSVELTNDPTGTEVIIGVKKGDIKQFRNDLIESVRYWDVKPIIMNDESFEYPTEKEVIIQGDRWCIFEKGNYSDVSTKAIIDGIAYPLDLYLVEKNFAQLSCKDTHVNSVFKQIKSTHLHLFFETGEVELVPNREAILYEERTIAAISSKLDILMSEINDIVKDRVDRCNTYLEAVKFLSSFHNSVKHPGDHTWRGNVVFHGKYGANVNIINENTSKNNVARLDTYSIGSVQKYSKSYKSPLILGIPLLINDDSKFVSRERINNYIREKGLHKANDTFQILVATDGDMDSLKARIKSCCNLDLDVLNPDFMSKYDSPKGTIVTTPVKSSNNVKPEKGTVRVNKLKQTPTALKSDLWHSVRVKTDTDSGIYVILEEQRTCIKKSITDNGPHIYVQNLFEIINVLELSGKQIYGVNKKIAEKLGNGFVSLESVMEEYKRNFIISQKEIQDCYESEYELSEYRELELFKCLKTFSIELKEVSFIESLISEHNVKINHLYKIKKVAKILGVALPNTTPSKTCKLNKLSNDIENKYPLLNHLYYWRNDKDSNKKLILSIKDYIKLVDESSESSLKQKAS